MTAPLERARSEATTVVSSGRLSAPSPARAGGEEGQGAAGEEGAAGREEGGDAEPVEAAAAPEEGTLSSMFASIGDSMLSFGGEGDAR